MANVLHKQTLQYLESVHTPDYDPEEWLINPDLSRVEGIDPKYWKLWRGVVKEMTVLEKDRTFLGDTKASAYRSVDARTQELISQGFVYNQLRFSLSQAAQLKMSDMRFLIDHGSVSEYPVVWDTLDDQGYVELASASEVLSFILAGLEAVIAIVKSGTQLKTGIRNASTIAATQAISDDR